MLPSNVHAEEEGPAKVSSLKVHASYTEAYLFLIQHVAACTPEIILTNILQIQVQATVL